MQYLSGHSPTHSLVFTDDWDLFPICFYYNDHNRYMVGLDPMFTKIPYPELWERYRLITRGQTPGTLEQRPSAPCTRLRLNAVSVQAIRKIPLVVVQRASCGSNPSRGVANAADGVSASRAGTSSDRRRRTSVG